MDLNVCLNQFYDRKIKINRNERAQALDVWEALVKEILAEVKRLDPRFAVQMLYTGSFYERVKTQSPDEFDLMLVLDKIRPDIRRKVVVPGFTFLYVTGDQIQQWRGDHIVDSDGRLNANQMRAVFSRLVNQVISAIQPNHSGKRITASTHGPAVTLNIVIDGSHYDVDLTLAVKLSNWPSVAETWRKRPRKGWPDKTMVDEISSGGCHVVAKKPPADSGKDKDFLWRLSFSEAEKAIMKKIDSGISNSVRRKVLQILKVIITNDPQLKSMPLKSYHMKTLIFWESEKYPNNEDWVGPKLQDRFLSAVKGILTYMKKKRFPHYFLNQVGLAAEFKDLHFQSVSDKFEEIKSDPVRYIRRIQSAM